jgi:hypothetical protein
VISFFNLVNKKLSVVSFVLYGLFDIGVFVFYLLLTITMYSLIDKTNGFHSGLGSAFVRVVQLVILVCLKYYTINFR